ncbi:GlxA family transcriptional regulator [Kribbella solani]|uniref:Transcriptional regulator GlxA family with amidase domain n=1 Tax=Kribbella solani TaxID=236067 RepID=A0A841DIE2_9ACTN|nr:helix-turn-helix domain-containing protein [Kribbella solani]MBB5977299.1 transcriptional regulator GlxA family with amidase domain [Kribbella solani]MDX2970558.1 helix-turn-helix domain-containing protein [Kribbella solani]MDX3006597.1 helix-turn-helix domain-containing protein [Kribbella solani]
MHRVAVVAADHVKTLELAIPGQVFGTASSQDKPVGEVFGAPLYEVAVCGERPDLVVCGRGGAVMFRMTAPHDLTAVLTADTVIVPGTRTDVEPSVEVLDVLRQAHGRGARIASVCCGAFVLAAAGLLDGRRATTHWTSAENLARRFPRVEVDPDVLFVDAGDVLTSAGAATGLDLCIHMVRNDFGAAVAADVARHIIIPPQRTGDQAQFIVHREPTADSGSLEPTMRWLRDRVGEPLTLSDIARHAAISPRTLNRRFREQTGMTPLQWLLTQRVRHAQELLETTSLSVEDIARHCGFGTAINLRQHFTRRVHLSPLAYRRAFQLG